MNNMNLKDKIVVITGGVSGLGRYMAEVFISRGAIVIVTTHSEVSEASTDKLIIMQSDIRNEDDVNKLADEVVAKFGRTDIWVNNAGIWYPNMPIEEVDMNRAHDVFETNVFGTMYGSRSAMIQMRKQQSGAIVNIVSTAVLKLRLMTSIYTASKCAVDGFTKGLRMELEGSGVKVFSIYPGGMKTNLFDEKKPADFDDYMDPNDIAKKIVDNIESENGELELIIRRPKK